MKFPIFFAALTALFTLTGLNAQSLAATSESNANRTVNILSDKDIVDIASENDAFTTLVTALKAAGLVETLKSEGPFTVFAPVNEAFAKLPAGVLETLLAPDNKEKLSKILTYHVVSGKFNAADVLAAIESNNGSYIIPTVSGASLTATVEDGKVVLTDAVGNKAAVVTTDVEASNGVIHVIDTVVLPEQLNSNN